MKHFAVGGGVMEIDGKGFNLVYSIGNV